MKRWIIFVLAVLAIVIIASSQVSVHLGGSDGESLLKNMTNSFSNLTATDNASGNLSTADNLKPIPKLLGNAEKVPLKNLANSSLNLTGRNNTTSDLANWGGKPLPPPPMSNDFDYKNAQIVKANRVE